MPSHSDSSEIVSTLVPSCERVAVALGCPVCGRQFSPHDLEIDDTGVELTCGRCFHIALRIDRE